MNLKFILLMITIVTMINIESTACHLPAHTLASVENRAYGINQSVLFNATASNNSGCTLNGWSTPYWYWDFHYNGSFNSERITTVGYSTYSFPQAGTYTVAVMYMDHAKQSGGIVVMTVEVVDLQRCYYLTDHLGSIKMTVSEGPSTVGLVGYWPFEEGGTDGSESNITASISSTNMYTAGKYGQGVSLTDEITKYIDLGLSETLRPGRISITAWIKPTGFVPVKENDIVVEEGYGYRIFYLSNGSLWFVIHDQTADLHDGNGELVYYVNNCINNDGNWHHIAATYGNDRRMRLFVDGELKGTSQVYTGGNGDIKYVNPQHVTVGHNGNWRAGMMGSIDEVKIYSRGLSQSEINRDYLHDVQILGYDDYDPWGKQLEGRCMNAENPQDKYKFTGKERDKETGYDYVTHRVYDSDIARWLQVDPMADKYPGWSPYNYCMNNPLIVIDPDGRDTLTFDHNGNYLRSIPGGEHVGHILDKDGNFKRSFAFLDPTDVKSIQTSNSDKWIPNGDGFKVKGIDLSFENTVIGKVLEGIAPVLGIFGPGAEFIKMAYAAGESFPMGKMDYVSHMDEPVNSKTAIIKLAILGNMSYNNLDAGNFMWGMGMSLLGQSPAGAQQAARMYERIIKGREDQVYDQTAIWNGASYLKVK